VPADAISRHDVPPAGAFPPSLNAELALVCGHQPDSEPLAEAEEPGSDQGDKLQYLER